MGALVGDRVELAFLLGVILAGFFELGLEGGDDALHEIRFLLVLVHGLDEGFAVFPEADFGLAEGVAFGDEKSLQA